MLVSVRIVNGWSFFIKTRKVVWARRLAHISRFEVEGVRRPQCWAGKCKPPTTWFCEKLLAVTFFVLPFNLAGLRWYSKIGLGLAEPPESEICLLALILLVGWVIGFYINGQCLELEDSLRLSEQQYAIEASWLTLPSHETVSEEESS